ncbi:MAG: DUF4835 family protein [Saprospiraceae bacterium]
MKKIIQILFLCVLVLGSATLSAQEFNLNVKVSAPNLKLVDPKLFDNLEKEMEEFMNSTTWTDQIFEAHERIIGNIQITISEELSKTSFKGEIVIQTSRPVYNSTYLSPVLRYLDRNLTFSYDGLRPIQKTTDGYIDNFSSILSFYAYYMLGADFDTYSNMGGDKYFEKAYNIYNNLPSNLQRGPGWTPDNNKQQNRYYLIENIRSPKFRRFRTAMYNYHRLGMDKMYNDVNNGRTVLLEAITDVGRVNKEVNNSILTRMFSDTKRLEIVDVFIIATPSEKTKVKNIMMSIDPTQSNAYRELR